MSADSYLISTPPRPQTGFASGRASPGPAALLMEMEFNLSLLQRSFPSRSEWPHRRYLETREMISKIQRDAASGERSDNRFLSGFDETGAEPRPHEIDIRTSSA